MWTKYTPMKTPEPKKTFLFIFTSFYLPTTSESERQAQRPVLDIA